MALTVIVVVVVVNNNNKKAGSCKLVLKTQRTHEIPLLPCHTTFTDKKDA